MQQLNQLEIGILDWIRENLSCNFLDVVMRSITILGDNGIFFILVAMVCLLFKKSRKFGSTLTIALVLEVIMINLTLKPLVGRMRPFIFNDAVELIVPALNSASFPSGHTGFAFAFALSLLVFGKKGLIPGLIFGVLMGFSRLYLYVHYPTDVLFGALIGALCGFIAYLITKKIYSYLDEDVEYFSDDLTDEDGETN